MLDEADVKELFPINMLGGTGTKKLNFLKTLEVGWYKKAPLGRANTKIIFFAENLKWGLYRKDHSTQYVRRGWHQKAQFKENARQDWYRKSFFKACVRYFLSNFYFSPNDSPSKTMKNVFYFI